MKAGDELVTYEQRRREYVYLTVLKELYSTPKLDNLDLWIWAKESKN